MDIDVKNEFFANCSSMSFCRVCLSADRALSTANEYVDIFCKFFDNQELILPDILLCWECLALLKKFRMFTRKVADAQKLLQFWYINKQDPFPHSLSTLSTYQQNNEIKINKEEDELKPVKTEPDFDNFDTFDNFDFDTDIKDEPEPETVKIDSESKIDIEPVKSDDQNYRKSKEFNEKRNRKRKAKYRFVNTKLKKHRRLLVRKVVVDVSEVVRSLEAERREDFFLKTEHKCVSCVEVFEDAEKAASHNNKYHDPSYPACPVCLARCAPAALAAHASRHARRECRACGYTCAAPARMRRHVAQHHRAVQCLACLLFFKNVRRFYDHHKALHSSFECDACGKRCKTRQMIEKHLRRHFGYECPFCKKKLKNSSTYSNHVEVQHTNSFAEAAYCVQCDKRFKSEKLYKRHLTVSSAHACERANSRAKRKYPCPECSNVYSRRTYMNNHYRHVHSKESKYYCEDCDQHFLNRTRFLDHRRFKHEGVQREKDKLCNICGRGFAANRTLENHLRTHSGERPFACPHCGAKFTQKHAMLSHVQYIHLKSKRKPSWRE